LTIDSRSKSNIHILKKSPTQIYSIIGISLVLFLLGVIGWLGINGRSLSRLVKENVTIDVILNDHTQDEKAKALEKILQQQSFVKDAVMISKEEALEKYVKEKNEDPVAFLGYNPLYISIKTTLHSEYVNPDSIALITKFIQQSNIVREVYYPNTIVSKLDSFIKNTSWILGILAGILIIAVIIIIDNTVRLSMYSNRMLIKTMQMVGAKRSFIAKPFSKQAFLSGLISASIATVGMLGIKYAAAEVFPEINVLNNTFLFISLIVALYLLGVLISVLSTNRSVIKYLKLKLDDLY
jgi:cell division transport system permease protein